MAIVNGTSGNNTLTGTSGNDQLNGLGGNDVLSGLAGNDTLNGGTGSDRMTGGAGNDTYIVDTSGDRAVELSNQGTDTVRASISFTLPANVENLVLLGTTNLNGTGNGLANRLTGNAGRNTLVGGAGNDILNGRQGDDDLRGGDGNDIYVVDHLGDITKSIADAGTDTVQASLSYALGAFQENLVLTGTANLSGTGNALANTLTGNAGANILNGGAGNDTLIGAAGADTLRGDTGNDLFLIGSAAELFPAEAINGGADTDTLRFTSTVAATLTLTANVIDIENVQIADAAGATTGAAAINVNASAIANGLTLIGNDGLNAITGTEQEDVIIGNGGADDLMGNGGNDLFFLNVAGDFAPGEKIDGGAGSDTLRYIGNGAATLVLTDLVTAVEHVNIADATGNASGTSAINVNAEAVATGLEITGNAGTNVLIGTNQGDSILGGDGDDILDGNLGTDDLRGGNGNDTFELDPADFAAGELINGNDGADTIRLTGAGQTFDLTAIADTDLINIEVIDLAGDTNILSLTAADVLSINSIGTLRVGGNAGDVVSAGAGWTYTRNLAAGAETYAEYVNGTATLLVDVDVDRSGVGVVGLNVNLLDGVSGLRVSGVFAGDLTGNFVSGAGDVNGDGFADLIIAAQGADPNGQFSGASYILFGKGGSFAPDLNLSTLNGSNGIAMYGAAANDSFIVSPLNPFGMTVSGAGDFNADGYDDVIIGTGGSDVNGSNSGTSYLVYGTGTQFSGPSVELSTLDTAGFKLVGAAADDFSGRVSNAGDINGDGFDDVVIGAPNADPNGTNSGQSYVVFGTSGGSPATIDLSALSGNDGFKLSGVVAESLSGHTVSAAGDINGDGVDDLIIGARAGPGYVVFGKTSGFASTVELSATALNGSDGFVLFDTNRYIWSVSGAGDVNGDGIDDFVVAAPDGAVGDSYVVFGTDLGFGANVNLALLNGVNGFKLRSGPGNPSTGVNVSSAGDVNGDGFDDLIIGEPYADSNGLQAGEVYIVFGKSNGFAANLDISTATEGIFRLVGGAAGDFFGNSVSGTGDVNGDGFDDVIIGARLADPTGSNSGASYLVFGQDFADSVDVMGTSGNDGLTGTTDDEALIGGLGNDTLDGAGGTDALTGAAGDDVFIFDPLDRHLDGGSGVDTLRFAGAGQVLDLTSIPSSRYENLEVIDLTGTGSNALTLSALDLLQLSDSSNDLYVYGNAGDTVNSVGQGWFANGTSVFGDQTFNDYAIADSDAVLHVQLGVTATVT